MNPAMVYIKIFHPCMGKNICKSEEFSLAKNTEFDKQPGICMVPNDGLEPTWYCYRWILSLEKPFIGLNIG